MQRMRLAVVAIALTGCSSILQQHACEPTAPAAPVTTAKNTTETEGQRRERLMSELSAKSIYFESNGFAVKPEYQEHLKQIYKFLESVPEYSVGLIGNADERGRGQNVSGQRRADAVRQVFRSFGLAEERIQAISLGDKNPRAACHAENCWAQNRRVDVVFLGPATSANAAMTTTNSR